MKKILVALFVFALLTGSVIGSFADDNSDVMAMPTCPPLERLVDLDPVSDYDTPLTGESFKLDGCAIYTDTDVSFDYLPVVKRGDREDKVVCITVDDCFQVDNLSRICDKACECGGKLTLFPIGKNLEKKRMPDIIRNAYFSYGFEIENHTWSHAKIFRVSDEELTNEIWKQDALLDSILGLNYQSHFLRLMGGDGEYDQRTHVYLKQLGYMGVADWSYSGSDADYEHIKRRVKPGEIFLFHTTNRDTKILMDFIPWLVSNGYQLITLNEMFNFPENETSEYVASEKPALDEYLVDWRVYKTGYYAWQVVKLQEALKSLGYLSLDGPATGFYGEATANAVFRYQVDHGLPATGEADAETQKRLLLGSNWGNNAGNQDAGASS